MICLTIPIVIYLLPAMQSDLDHGIRHLLPILPMIFVSVAIVFARAIRIWPRTVGAVGTILLIGLATESLNAFPDYIPFFNVAAGGSRGGIRLLGDSNLDWGQDLLLLAKWRQLHPDVKLYAATFGAIDPVRLGVQYVPLPSGYWGNQNSALPDPNQPCVLAIGASILQGIYVREPWESLYAEIRTWKPREVLGGSIYLYDFPSPEMSHHLTGRDR